jgi:hypothetical protein
VFGVEAHGFCPLPAVKTAARRATKRLHE